MILSPNCGNAQNVSATIRKSTQALQFYMHAQLVSMRTSIADLVRQSARLFIVLLGSHVTSANLSTACRNMRIPNYNSGVVSYTELQILDLMVL